MEQLWPKTTKWKYWRKSLQYKQVQIDSSTARFLPSITTDIDKPARHWSRRLCSWDHEPQTEPHSVHTCTCPAAWQVAGSWRTPPASHVVECHSQQGAPRRPQSSHAADSTPPPAPDLQNILWFVRLSYPYSKINSGLWYAKDFSDEKS